MSVVWVEYPELTPQLIDLWNGGKSAKEIAPILGHGLSRSAITTKIARLRVAGVEMRSAVVFQPKSIMRGKPFKDPEPDIDPRSISPVYLDGQPVTVLNAKDSHCRYAYGEPFEPDFRYCGRQTAKGSFCQDHAAICYQLMHQRRPNEDEAA